MEKKRADIELEKRKDYEWAMDRRDEIEKLKKRIKIEKDRKIKIELLLKIESMYEELKIYAEFDEQDDIDLKDIIEKRRYIEHVVTYEEDNRVTYYDQKSEETYEVGNEEEER